MRLTSSALFSASTSLPFIWLNQLKIKTLCFLYSECSGTQYNESIICQGTASLLSQALAFIEMLDLDRCVDLLLLYIEERDRLEGSSLSCQECFSTIVVLPIFKGQILLRFKGQKIDFPQFLQQMPVSPFQTSCMRVLRACRTQTMHLRLLFIRLARRTKQLVWCYTLRPPFSGDRRLPSLDEQ